MRSLYSILESITDSDEEIDVRNERYLDFIKTLDQIIEVIYKNFKPYYSGWYKSSADSYIFEFKKFKDEDELLIAIRKTKEEITRGIRTRFTGIGIIYPNNPRRNAYEMNALINDFKGNHMSVFIDEASTEAKSNRVVIRTLNAYSAGENFAGYFEEHLKERLRKRK